VTGLTNKLYAFSTSFLSKIVHLYPSQYDEIYVLDLVEQLIMLFDQVSGEFHAGLIRRMLDVVRYERRIALPPRLDLVADSSPTRARRYGALPIH
jgi:hypothetical protein